MVPVMNIHDMARVMDPLEFEKYAAELLSGAPALGSIERAWYILDLQHQPALVVCKHLVHNPEDVMHLHTLLVKYNFRRGYLITPGKFSQAIRDARKAFADEILLLDGNDLEDIRRSVEKG